MKDLRRLGHLYLKFRTSQCGAPWLVFRQSKWTNIQQDSLGLLFLVHRCCYILLTFFHSWLWRTDIFLIFFYCCCNYCSRGVGRDDEPILDDECHSFCPSVRLQIILSKYSDLRVNFCMSLLVVCSASCLLLPVASGKTWHTGVTSQKWCIWSKEVNTDLEIRRKGGLKTVWH